MKKIFFTITMVIFSLMTYSQKIEQKHKNYYPTSDVLNINKIQLMKDFNLARSYNTKFNRNILTGGSLVTIGAVGMVYYCSKVPIYYNYNTNSDELPELRDYNYLNKKAKDTKIERRNGIIVSSALIIIGSYFTFKAFKYKRLAIECLSPYGIVNVKFQISRNKKRSNEKRN